MIAWHLCGTLALVLLSVTLSSQHFAPKDLGSNKQRKNKFKNLKK